MHVHEHSPISRWRIWTHLPGLPVTVQHFFLGGALHYFTSTLSTVTSYPWWNDQREWHGWHILDLAAQTKIKWLLLEQEKFTFGSRRRPVRQQNTLIGIGPPIAFLVRWSHCNLSDA